MSFFVQTGPSARGRLAEALGGSIGQGIGQSIAQGQQRQIQRQQAGVLSKLLSGQATPEEEAILDPATRIEVEKVRAKQQEVQQRQLAEQQKLQQQQMEAPLLAKFQRGEELSPQEMAQLSPTSLRTLIGQQKPAFEPTEERLEAERVSTLATEIENDYKAYQSEEQRLGRMEKLSDKGQLTTPLMNKALQAFNLPLGVLGNPDSEEYAKLEADFLRDVRNVFPGGRITNFEIQAYLKTVPSLLNSAEGKAAIIRNRKLQNEAKKLRYDAYKDILKENKGKKPRNLGLMISERTGARLAAIENEFREGIQQEIEKFQQPVRMVDNQGRIVDIPANSIEEALQAGAKFR